MRFWSGLITNLENASFVPEFFLKMGVIKK